MRGTSRQFDVLGRVTRETDPAGGVTTYLYTGLDVTRTDAANLYRPSLVIERSAARALNVSRLCAMPRMS